MRRLLTITLPALIADQWLFVPAGGRGRVRAIDGISGEFTPGGREVAAFPRIEGWCCGTR